MEELIFLEEREDGDEILSLGNTQFMQDLKQTYGDEIHDKVELMISKSKKTTLNISSHSDRFSSDAEINGETFSYQRYDCGKFDSGADCMYINIRHKVNDNGWSSVLSFEDDFVGRELRVKIGKNVRIIKEKMGFKELSNETFVACLLKSMNLGPNDKDRLIKSLSKAKEE